MPMSEYMRSVRERVGQMLLEVPSVAVLTFDSRDRVLLVRHADLDVWTTPGGAVEPEEVPADAAVRETWEETGLHVEPTRVLGVYGGPEFVVTYSNGDAVSFLTTVFEGRRLAGELRPDGVETLDLAYFAQADLAGLELQRWTRMVLADAFGDRSRTRFAAPTWRPSGA